MQDLDSIIRDNTGLIFTQLKQMCVLNDPDAESIGYEALYSAAITFDVSKGYKFSTYATCCIYNALGSYIRTLNRKRQLEMVSYNNIAYSDETGTHEHLDFLCSTADVEADYLHGELLKKLCEEYQTSYNKLTNPKHRAIVHAWHEADYDISNKDIAKIVGVSQPYVNQVINTFKHGLKKKVEAYING